MRGTRVHDDEHMRAGDPDLMSYLSKLKQYTLGITVLYFASRNSYCRLSTRVLLRNICLRNKR